MISFLIWIVTKFCFSGPTKFTESNRAEYLLFVIFLQIVVENEIFSDLFPPLLFLCLNFRGKFEYLFDLELYLIESADN